MGIGQVLQSNVHNLFIVPSNKEPVHSESAMIWPSSRGRGPARVIIAV